VQIVHFMTARLNDLITVVNTVVLNLVNIKNLCLVLVIILTNQ